MNQVETHVGIMLAAGLEDHEILRLAEFKHRVTAGERDDLTPEYKRIMFMKYLFDSGRVQS